MTRQPARPPTRPLNADRRANRPFPAHPGGASPRRRRRAALACVCVLLATPLGAVTPPGNVSELEQTNRASAQQLDRVQRLPGYLTPSERLTRQREQRQLGRQQRDAQRALQQRQQQQLQQLNLRGRTLPPGPVPPHLQGLDLQRQFQLQQQQQLDRFRLQRPPLSR